MTARPAPPAWVRAVQGITLVEMLVALALGLVLVIGVMGIYLSSRETFRTNENLARLQESARFAFDLLAREAREVGLVACGTPLTANAIRSTGTPVQDWWVDTDAGMVRGFDNNQPSAGLASAGRPRVSGTDALVLLRPASEEGSLGRVQSHDAANNRFTMQSVSGFQPQDIVLACDYRSSALLQIASVNSQTLEIGYDTSGLNCTTALSSIGSQCAAPSTKTFGTGSVIAKWEPVFWYVAENDTGSRSLYRLRMVKPAGSTGSWTSRPEEVARDVYDLQIDYLSRDRGNGGVLANAWVDATRFAGGWNQQGLEVAGLRIALTLRSPAAGGSTGQVLERRLVGVVALRNREY